jgi:hypothetical protein
VLRERYIAFLKFRTTPGLRALRHTVSPYCHCAVTVFPTYAVSAAIAPSTARIIAALTIRFRHGRAKRSEAVGHGESLIRSRAEDLTRLVATAVRNRQSCLFSIFKRDSARASRRRWEAPPWDRSTKRSLLLRAHRAPRCSGNGRGGSDNVCHCEFLCPRHARGHERQAHRWGTTRGKIGFHGKVEKRLGEARINVMRAFERIGLELFVEPADGMFVWARFPHVDDSLTLAEASQRDGMMLAPGAVFRPHLESSWMRFNVTTCDDTRVQRWLTCQVASRAA